jgi:serine/threonine protein kinase
MNPKIAVTWPTDLVVSDEAKDFVSKLFQRDPEKRLEIKQIKNHKFFESIDWENLLRTESVPFKPVLQHADDTVYFPGNLECD